MKKPVEKDFLEQNDPEDNAPKIIDDYKDMPIETLHSSKLKFLIWRDFTDDR